jgi:hypothetical protein
MVYKSISIHNGKVLVFRKTTGYRCICLTYFFETVTKCLYSFIVMPSIIIENLQIQFHYDKTHSHNCLQTSQLHSWTKALTKVNPLGRVQVNIYLHIYKF